MSLGPENTETYLLSATGLLFVSAVFSGLKRRLPLWSQIGFRVLTLCMLTVMVRGILGSPLAPHYSNAGEGWTLWGRAIEAGWWLVAANTAVTIGRVFVVLENRPRETRIVSDLIGGAVYIATVLAIVNFSFDVSVRGALATSGIVAIVLGLALQSTLADVFSGIAVGLERPYNPGDLVWIEGNIEGRIVQVNWRSTWIATGNDDIAIVPNSVMAKARIVNRSAPTQTRGDVIIFELDPHIAPDKCTDTLRAATLSCHIPLAHPAAVIACSGLKGDGARYEITFFVASSNALAAARAELLSQAHRHLRFAGIALAIAGSATLAKVSIPTPAEVLEQSDLFGTMDAEGRNFLAEHFTPRWLETSDVLLREGEMSGALFVLVSGAAEITKHGPGGLQQVLHRIGPGETLGAIGLLTGAAMEVTVTALTPIKVYALSKTDIAEAIKIRPEVATGLEALASRGHTALQRFATEHEKEQLAQPDVLMFKLRHFLHLLGT